MGELTNWIAGDLTPRARVLTALAPAIIVSGWFIVGYIAFALRCWFWGPPRQFEKETRGRTAFIGTHLRLYFFWMVNPLWRLLLASGLSANAVTGMAAAWVWARRWRRAPGGSGWRAGCSSCRASST